MRGCFPAAQRLAFSLRALIIKWGELENEFSRVGSGTFLNAASLTNRPVDGDESHCFGVLVAAILTSKHCDTPRRHCFSVAGSRSSIEAARRILNVLRSMGHEVLTSHLVQEDAWEADRRVAPQEIFARDMKWLAECDFFIAEVSGSSFGVGFETGYLLGATTKKTILFFERNAQSTGFRS
jgi:Nucleoside 2-deoxyribosyltransferase